MDIILTDIHGGIIFSNVPAEDHPKPPFPKNETFICNKEMCKKRRGSVITETGSVYLCTSEVNKVRSSKLFKKHLEMYSGLLSTFNSAQKDLSATYVDNVSRILHNVITINAQNIQEIYSLVPQDELTRDLKEQLSTVKKRLMQNPDDAASTFFRLIKNNLLIKTEFQVFKSLNNPEKKLSKRRHVIRKIIMNVFHTFFYDFKEKMSMSILNNAILKFLRIIQPYPELLFT